jgi:hypothetical protein
MKSRSLKGTEILVKNNNNKINQKEKENKKSE